MPNLFDNLPTAWRALAKPSEQLQTFVNSLDFTKTLPDQAKLFRAFSYFKPEDTKVIILGLEPYPQRLHASGLAFSSDAKAIPASLMNIRKELRNCGYESGGTPSLEHWARQGVLLLNTCLTVEEKLPSSHRGKGWEEWSTALLKGLVSLKKQLVISAWGIDAQKIANALPLAVGQHLIYHGHPSPLNRANNFVGTNVFRHANGRLMDAGLKPINWGE